jgi:hypothetical protein
MDAPCPHGRRVASSLTDFSSADGKNRLQAKSRPRGKHGRARTSGRKEWRTVNFIQKRPLCQP